MTLTLGPALVAVLAEDPLSDVVSGIAHIEPLAWLRRPELRGPRLHADWAAVGLRPPLVARHESSDGRVPLYLLPKIEDSDPEPLDHRRLEEPHLLAERLAALVGGDMRVLPASGSVSAALTFEELTEAVRGIDSVAVIDLDPLVEVALLDTALPSIGLAPGGPALRRAQHVRVAVLDGGIDGSHPALTVTQAVSTYAGEPATVPSDHGTHVAGCLASRDRQFGGMAPDVELLDVKVTSSSGLSNQASFSDGIDEALQLDPHILVISLGRSHIPTAALPPHACPIVLSDGSTTACPWCRAAETAVADNRIVVVAAGNDHGEAERLRAGGQGLAYDTELRCPGQATGVVLVGAMDDSHNPAAFSSNGPGSRPDVGISLVAPGVDVCSSVPVASFPNPSMAFRPMNGTSQAAPIVAGAAAILVADALSAGEDFHADVIRQRLLRDHVQPLTAPRNVVGAGRLDLSKLTVSP